MDFLSDTTKKERRNLLAAGFAGIIVAQLKIYPQQIDVLGLKFQSPDLPILAVGGLLAAISYFLIKFYFSYRYEQGSAETKILSIQIHEGKTAIDVAREEEELSERAHALIQQTEVVRKQQVNEERRIERLEEKINEQDTIDEGTIQAMDQKINDLEKALATGKPELGQKYLPPFQKIRDFDASWKPIFEQELKMAEQARASFLDHAKRKKQEEIENVGNEKKARKEMRDAHARELEINENIYNEKRRNIALWKRAHKTFGIVSPLHLFLEIRLPLIVGAVAIVSLIYLMLHFPPPPKPPSLPEF